MEVEFEFVDEGGLDVVRGGGEVMVEGYGGCYFEERI